jgi:ABC-2 type transport system ATP-binding protein
MQLRINQLSKTYANGVQALKKVDLSIFNGMFGLLGPNGAGKSTLMRTIATLQEADEGSISLDHLNVLEDKTQIRRILGYLPQNFGLYEDVNAEQMLHHIAHLKGITRKHQRRVAVETLLRKTNLYELRKRRLGTYSGGMKQRFGIAQALLANPRLIIVDEPTAGLDPEERNRFYNLLGDISQDCIVILSTHIVDDIQQLCNQMAIIYEGEVLSTDTPTQAINCLKGRIWGKSIKKQQLPEYKEKFNVILTRLLSGNVVIHVLAEDAPAPGFQSVAPELEHVYFSVVQDLKKKLPIALN